jgi:pseudouridine synthase
MNREFLLSCDDSNKKEYTDATMNFEPRERLHKVIAASGICSRREAEQLIADGRVAVNGKRIGKMGVKVTASDKIQVDGQLLPEKGAAITLALHKPRGVLTSKSDPFHNETVMDLLPPEYGHLNPVGRLDKDSEGLLLFTSDGALLERLTHPSFEHEKTYEVLVMGHPGEDVIEGIRKGGMKLDDYALRPMGAKILSIEGKDTWLEIKLKEGRKRQIRRVMEWFGHPVIRLIRRSVGAIELGKLRPGEWRELTAEDLKKLA